MSREKIYEWGRKLDAGEGHDPLLDISRRLSSLHIKSVSTPTDFREALLDNLLSKHKPQSASTPRPRRFLTLDVVVAVMIVALLMGTFLVNLWEPSSPGAGITPGNQPIAGSGTSTGIHAAPPLLVSPQSCAQASPSEVPHVSLPLRPDRVLGGGTVENGPFIFDLWLYCDTELGTEISPYLSIGGLGMHNAWVYVGPYVDGDVLYSFGVLPDISPSTGWDDQGLTTLSGGSTTRGFCCQEESELRQAIQAGERIAFAMKVESGAGSYGAVLSFRLVEAADGYNPQDIIVLPLSQEPYEPFVGGGDDSYVRGLRNATFIGPLEMSIPGGNATAGQGWLELTIGPDGTSIVLWRYSLLHAYCSNDSGRLRQEDYGFVMSAGFPTPVLIENGMFEFDYAGELKVSGQFTSPTEVIAEVKILTVGYPDRTGNFFMCDFGTWNWSAEATVPPYSEFIIPRGIPE